MCKQIFVDLMSTKSSIEHKRILELNKDNQDFLMLLKHYLDPKVSTGISKSKIKTIMQLDVGDSKDTLQSILEYVKVNNTGKKDVLERIGTFTKDEIILRLITKTIKLGVGASTVNAVLPNFIQEPNFMLAHKFNESVNPESWYAISTKLDGNRASYKDGVWMSKNGLIIEGIDIDMSGLNQEYEYDGELIAMAGKTSAEVYKNTSKIMRSKGIKSGLKFVIFDLIEDGTWKQRRQLLNHLITLITQDNIELIGIIDFVKGSDMEAIKCLLRDAIAKDEEGLMANDVEALYDRGKRSKNILKIKEFHDAEFKCVGVEEGSGDLKGTLGSITIENNGVLVSVGSGFNRSDRDYFWNNKNEIIGKNVTVRYFEVTEDGSLRFPVYKGIKNILE